MSQFLDFKERRKLNHLATYSYSLLCFSLVLELISFMSVQAVACLFFTLCYSPF